MSRLGGLVRQFRALFAKERVERELDEELAFHVDMATARNIERGMSPFAARRQALLHFHGVERHKEGVRDNRWTRLVEDALQDTRFAVRSLARQPLLAVVAALTIGIGVGAASSVFSLTRALLLQPLPVPNAGRLYTLVEERGGHVRQNNAEMTLPWSRVEAYAEALSGVLDAMGAYAHVTVALQQGGASQATNGMIVSPGFFDVLGVQPALGRFPTADDGDVVVLSHRAWRARFGGAASALGNVVNVDSRPYTVIGVAPSGFGGLMRWIPTDVYMPWTGSLRQAGAGGTWFVPFGTLASGVPHAAADEAVRAAALRIPPDEPNTTVRGARLAPLTGIPAMARAGIGWFMALLFAAAGLLLFTACANIAAVLLARDVVRRQEIAVRLAMGAARGRIMRQLLAETIVLFSLGAALGIMLAQAATAGLGRVRMPFAEQVALDATPDAAVLLFALGLALVTGVLFGLVPAARATRTDLVSALRASAGSPGATRTRGLFVSAQVAVAVVLLMTAGLFVRSLQAALRVDPGFDAAGVLVVSANLAPHGYDEARGRAFQQELLARVQALPGVQDAALAQLPVLGGPSHRNDVHGPVDATGERPRTNATLNRVDEHFAATISLRLVEGRWFEPGDGDGAPPVVVVNETAARLLWPDGSATGSRLRLWSGEHEVVGVVPAGRYDGLASPAGPHVYLPIRQHYAPRVTLHVRPRPGMAAGAVLADVRGVLAGLDPNIAAEGEMRLAEVMAFTLLPQRFAASAVGVFGIAGLFLAALGLYGVLAHFVAQHARELAIRSALGAGRGEVMRLVLRRALVLAVTGCAAGLLAAAGAAQAIRAFLTGIQPLDVVLSAAVPALLIVTALAAAALPARRALRADPLEVLRAE